MTKKNLYFSICFLQSESQFQVKREKSKIFFLSLLTVVRLGLPVMFGVSQRKGRVSTACETRALLRLQATHPHVLQAVSGRGVHLGLRVYVGAHAERITATVILGSRSGTQHLFLFLLMLLLLLLLMDVVVWAP